MSERTNDQQTMMSPDASSAIKTRISILTSHVYKNILTFFESIKEFVFRYNTADTELWKSTTSLWPAKAATIVAMCGQNIPTSPTESLKFCLDIFDKLADLDSDIRILRRLINNDIYIGLMRTQNEFALTKDYMALLKRIDENIVTYRQKQITDRLPVIYASFDAIVGVVPNANMISSIVIAAKQNDYLVHVIREIITHVDNTALVGTLNDRVEQLKDDAMNSATYVDNLCPDRFIKSDIGETDPDITDSKFLLLMRRHIVGSGSYMTVDELFAAHNGEYNSGTSIHLNLRRFANLVSANVMIIHNNSVRKLIEYRSSIVIAAAKPTVNIVDTITAEIADISDSVDTQTVTGGAATPDIPGINEDLLKLYSTIYSVDLPEVSNPPTLKTPFAFYYADEENNKDERWLVFECIRFRQYRVMITIDNETYMTKRDIDKLTSVCMRSHNYNAICESAIIARAIGQKHRDFINRFESAIETRKVTETSRKRIAADAIDTLTFIDLTKIQNPVDFFDAISSKEFISKLKQTLNKCLFEEIYKQKVQTRKSVEINISYTYTSDILLSKFFREYDNIVGNIKNTGKVIKSRLTADTNAVKYLTGWFTQIINSTMPILDTTPGSLDDLLFGMKEFYIKTNYELA